MPHGVSKKLHAELQQRARAHAGTLRDALAARDGPDKEGAWKLTAAALEIHPDEYSLWSWRRIQLLQVASGDLSAQSLTGATDVDLPETSVNHPQASEKSSTEALSLWQQELTLTMRALKRHPKAYPCWQHRFWLLSWEHVPSAAREEAVRSEKKLSSLMLAKDGRNFHGWAHRLRVRALTSMTDEKELASELKFSRSKINADFTNYSAWHVRSKVLPQVKKIQRKELANELEYVRQAFYTEPDVQSGWFYHRWLLAGMPGTSGRLEIDTELWERELEACDELLEVEQNARWVLHTKAHILGHLGRRGEAVEVFERLAEIDPMRLGFYRDRIAKLNMEGGDVLKSK